MSSDLNDRFRGTRSRLRRVVWGRGLAWILFALMVCVLVSCAIDYVFHVSSGMRVLFLLTVATAAIVLSYRYLFQPLSTLVSDLDLALLVERRHPELAEALSATVSFQKQAIDDSMAGSPSLRRAVIERAVGQVEQIDFGEVIEPRPARRAMQAAAVIFLLAATVVFVDPLSAGIALRRLGDPFGTTEWPKRTILQLASVPSRIAKGDPFHVEVDVKGVVPSRMEVEYRFADGQAPAPTAMTLSMETTNRFVGSLPAAMQSFRFLVRGGDAETEWTPIDVVPAPDVETLVLAVTPPAYTKLPAMEYPSGRGHVDSVVGTQVRVLAESNKPIVGGWILWQTGASTPGVVQDDGRTLLAEFTVTKDDSYRVILEDKEGMTNEHRSPKPYRVKAIQDSAPEVKLEQPAGDLEVTQKARLPVRAIVRDDFGVQDVTLCYRLETPGSESPKAGGKDEAFERIPMGLDAESQRWFLNWELSDLKLSLGSVVVLKVSARDFRESPGPNVGESREVRLRILSESDFLRQVEGEQRLLREELDRLKKLQENALTQTRDLTEKTIASGRLDDPDREKLQSAETIQRRVREKTTESDDSIQKKIRDLIDRLSTNRANDLDTNKRLALMDSELGRIAEQQLPEIERSLTQARKSSGGRSSAGQKRSSDQADKSLSPDQTPSQASKSDSGSPNAPSSDQTRKSRNRNDESKPSKEDPARPNRSRNGTGQRKSDSTSKQEGQGDPQEDVSPSSTSNPEKGPNEQDPASTSPNPKKDQPSAPIPPENQVASALDRARDHQQQVVDSIDAMLDQLDKWESVADVVNEARDLERKQSEASRKVDESAKATLGKNPEELTKEEKGALGQAAAKQEELRQQLGRLERKMSRQADRAKEDDPAAAEAMQQALKESQEANLGGKMSQAASDIRENKLADAGQRQSEIARSLRSLVESLENRQERELKKLIQDLKQAEQDLEQIRTEQKRLQKETRNADRISDPDAKKEELARLQRRQAELQKKAEEFARRLSRMQAKAASKNSGRAASRMADASRSMQQGQQGEATDKQEESLDELQQAQEELARARQNAQDQLAREQLAKVADTIRDIHQRQVALKEDVLRLNGIKDKEGKWTRGQIQSLLGLSRAQGGLAEESAALKERLAEAKIFALVIEDAAGQMRQASTRLSEKSTGPDAQRPMDRAARKFAQLLDSLRRDPSQAANRKQQQQEQQGGEGEGGAGGAGDEQQDGIPGIAQIKLLKGLQEEILEETRELAQAKTDKGWNDDDHKQFEKLSERQGKLADLIRELTEPEEEAPLVPEDKK